MTDLILRPSGLEERHNKPWSLQLRDHGPVETFYETLCRVDDETARCIIGAGKPYWLFGEPDWSKREALRAQERARVLREQADAIEAEAAAQSTRLPR